jgi:hypothetical protein
MKHVEIYNYIYKVKKYPLNYWNYVAKEKTLDLWSVF